MNSKFFIDHGTLVSSTMSEVIQNTTNQLAKKREECIVSQLNDFISRGLINVRTTGPTIIQSQDQSGIEIREQVILELKDKEYIEQLEKENSELKQIVDTFKKALKETNNG